MTTGAFVRIKRNGRWVNLDITELTDDELRTFLQETPRAKLVEWVVFLAGWIRDNVQAVDDFREIVWSLHGEHKERQ